MEVLYLLKALYRRKWIIALCTVLALVAAFIFTMQEKKEYKSVAQIATGFTTSDEVKLSDDKFNVPQIELKFNNAIENFNSSKVISLLSYDLMLHDLTQKNPFTQVSKAQTSSLQIKPAEAVDVLTTKLYQLQPLNPDIPKEAELIRYTKAYGYDLESIKKNLDVSRVPHTDYINVTYISENPELSAFAVNNLINEFLNYYNQNRRQRSDTSVATLDSLVKQKKADLDQKIQTRSNYMASHGIVDVNMEGSSKLQQINNFQSQLNQERGNRENLMYRIQQLDKMIKDEKSGSKSGSGSSDNLDYVILKNQYNQLYNEYTQKGSNDPALKKKLDDLRAKMQDLQPTVTSTATNSGTYLDDLKQKKMDAEGDLKSSEQKIASLQTMLNQLNSGLSGMASQGAGLDQLDKEIEIASAEYTKAKERLNTALNANELGASLFRQTLYGQPALQPEPAHKALKIALAGICALVLSSLVIVFIELIDQSIKTPSHFSTMTHLPLLGVINKVKLTPNVLQEVAIYNNTEKRDHVFRELLRKVRYEIENSGKKIFLFTSTEPKQGKTTLIQALAYSLSLVKKKVLIIDTNFCNNDLTTLLSANPVLEKFHVNGKPFDVKDIDRLVTKTGVEGVDMIGCIGGNYTPREILPANHLLNYLPELTRAYDFIFLEGAPLNDFTDTKELIHYSEGVVAVFSSEASLSAVDKESIKFFKQNKEKFLGAILNKVPAEDLDK